jgi:hypothetical protein
VSSAAGLLFDSGRVVFKRRCDSKKSVITGGLAGKLVISFQNWMAWMFLDPQLPIHEAAR